MPYITYKQRLYWTVGWVNRPMGIYHPDYHRYKGSDDEAPDTRSFLQCLPFEYVDILSSARRVRCLR